MKLIFIYNAKSAISNRLFDYAHKIISPSSYSCDLCKLTHSNFGERQEWKNFRKNNSTEIDFYHINDFETKYKQYFDYPVIINKNFDVILDNKQILEFKNVTELILELKKLK